MRKSRPDIPDPIECKGPDIKDNCFFHIDCTIFFMSTVPEFWKLLPIKWLATTRHIPFNEAANMERFIQPASRKPGPHPVLILAYLPDTRPDTDFFCSFHPNHFIAVLLCVLTQGENFPHKPIKDTNQAYTRVCGFSWLLCQPNDEHVNWSQEILLSMVVQHLNFNNQENFEQILE